MRILGVTSLSRILEKDLIGEDFGGDLSVEDFGEGPHW